jgi:sporulation protein YlmC with PRC-barrel domain
MLLKTAPDRSAKAIRDREAGDGNGRIAIDRHDGGRRGVTRKPTKGDEPGAVDAAPLIASAKTTRPADRNTKAPAWKNDAGLHETKDIIGTRITNAAGKHLGEIDQLLIDRNGKVSHVVIGLGGFAGVGEKKVVVPWSDLKFAPVTEGKKNAITMDEAKLESAPRYDRSARSDAAPGRKPAHPFSGEG